MLRKRLLLLNLLCALLRPRLIQCALPTIDKPLGDILVDYCSVKKVVIADDAYGDGLNGRKVTLTLLDSQYNVIKSNSQYISFDAEKRTLYIVPQKSQSPKQILYNIRVINADGDFANDSFFLIFDEPFPKRMFDVKIGAMMQRRRETDVENLYAFMTKLEQYLRSVNSDVNVFIYDYFIVSDGTLQVTFQDCSFTQTDDSCNRKNIFDFKSLMCSDREYTYVDACAISDVFSTFMTPDYEVNSISFAQKLPTCITNNPPGFRNELNDVINTGLEKITIYPGIVDLSFTAAYVFDEGKKADDVIFGYLVYLDFSASPPKWVPFDLTHYAYVKNFNDGSYTVFITITDQAFADAEKFQNDMTFHVNFLRFTDYNKEGDGIVVSLRSLLNNRPNYYYRVEFTFSSFVITDTSYAWAIHMQTFLNTLIDVLGRGVYAQYVYLREFSLSGGVNAQTPQTTSGTVVWGLDFGANCDFQIIAQTQAIMFAADGSGTLNSQFVQDMRKTLELTNIFDKRDGVCKLNPPFKTDTLPKLQFSYCGLNSYIIPEKAFTDKEDGFTRNLILSLLDEDQKPLSQDSWVQFVTTTQTVTAIVPSTIASGINYKFYLLVTDNSGQSIYCELLILVSGSNPPKSFFIEFRGAFNKAASSFPNAVHALQSKVKDWLQSTTDEFRLLTQGVSTNQEEIITFSSCSFRDFPCDALKIDAYKNKFFLPKKIVRPEFKSTLANDFQSTIFSWYEEGACAVNNPPTLSNPWGPITTSTCETFSALVPSDTFTDVEQGDLRNLACTLTPISETADLPVWLRFDTVSQRLEALTYQALIPNSFAYIMQATDINGAAATQNLQIQILKQAAPPSHLILLLLELKGNLNSFIDLYSALRTNIRQFFGDTLVNTVDYQELSSYPSTTYSVTWSNCSLSTTVCELQKYAYIKSQVLSDEFTLSLSKNFQLKSVSITENGVCKQEITPPRVVNKIPTQNVGYCSFLKYIIPENTFYDDIDGNTRNLNLKMFRSDFSQLPSNGILTFDESRQEMTVVLTSTPAKLSSYSYIVQATTKRGKSITTPLQLQIQGQPIDLKSYMQISLTTDLTASNSVTNAVSTFLEMFSEVFKLNINNVHAYEVTSQNNFLSMKVTTCGAQTCTGEIETIRMNINAYDTTKFLPQFSVQSRKAERSGRCQGRPPIVVQIPKAIAVSTCESFEYNLESEIFKDDDGSENLDYLVTKVGDEFIVKNEAWLGMTGLKMRGIITYDVYNKQPPSGYVLTIRATNSYNLYTETTVKLTISGATPQIFYKYNMQLAQFNTVTSKLDREVQISNAMNVFFGQKITNFISYEVNTLSEFSLQWSVCTLPNRCTKEGLSSYSLRIFTASSQVASAFSELFKQINMDLKSISEDVRQEYRGPFNGPTASINPYKITVMYCGGFVHRISETLFSDVEDGKTADLSLVLQMNGKSIESQLSWLQFEDQTLTGMPVYSHAKDYTLELTAFDSCGLQSTVSMEIKFEMPYQSPSYFYKFYFNQQINQRVVSMFSFMDKIAQFQGDVDRRNIGLYEIQKKLISYFNCSVSYDPCDEYRLNRVKDSYLDQDNKPNEALVNTMGQNFPVYFVQGVKLSRCSGPYTPVVHIDPAPLRLHICGWYLYTVPEVTFYDYGQGFTQNLKLTMSASKYLQFSSSAQQAVIMLATSMISTTNIFTFQLTATNDQLLKIHTDIQLSVLGPYSILNECEIKVHLAKTTIIPLSNIEVMQFILKKMATFFQIQQHEIGLINFYDDASSFYFSWSFCSLLYREIQQNSLDAPVDYVGFQQKVLMKLFFDDRKTFTDAFGDLFSEYFSVSSVTTVFTKRCANFPPIQIESGISMLISTGGYYIHEYKNNYFYDFNDGWAYNLQMSLRSSDDAVLHTDNWINVDVVKHRIIAVVNSFVRQTATSTYIFYLRATDPSGLYSQITVNVVKDNIVLKSAPFFINYYFEYKGQPGDVYVIQSSYIVNQIQSYFQSVMSIYNIMVLTLVRVSGYAEYRKITWSLADETCTSSVLQIIKSIYTSSGILIPSFLQSFTTSTVFIPKLINYESTCETDATNPTPGSTIPPQVVPYCVVYIKKIPENLFFDNFGGVRRMTLRLLTGNGDPLPTNSWIQINSATQEIYGISTQSVLNVQTIYKYMIEASNSANLTAQSPFDIQLSGEPFTSDCKITATFTYLYATKGLVDLDVLRQFVEMLSDYYGQSSTSNIKVISFERLSSKSYEIVWSNCSFSFPTNQEAVQGLNEKHRAEIEVMFAKVLSIGDEVNFDFQYAMAAYFRIHSVSVNDDCIERSPQVNRKEHNAIAEFCKLFYVRVPEDAFLDLKDGNTRNLHLTLTLENGNPIPVDNWLQINNEQYIYGVLTEEVAQHADVYRYLVVARDSSQRTANMTCIIRVAKRQLPFDVFFRTGFYSILGPVANRLFQFVGKMAAYLDANDNVGRIYIKQFTYPSTVVWSHCALQPCIVEKVENIYRRLTTTLQSPVTLFVEAMKPDFLPYSTRLFIANEKCASQGDKTIITVVTPLNVPQCGLATYSIPLNMFTDITGRTTRSFYLNLYEENGGTISRSSWLRFNATSQYVYAIPYAYLAPGSFVYKLQGVHPKSGLVSTIDMQLQIQSYNQLVSVRDQLCYFEFVLTVKYNPSYDDVTLVFFFLNTLSSYLKTTIGDIQMFRYERMSSGYPFAFKLSWTKCSLSAEYLSSSEAYYATVSSLTELVFLKVDNNYALNLLVIEFFNANSMFEITSATRSAKCNRPDKTPPQPATDRLNFDIVCGVIEEEIPADTFNDPQDGNTRQLALTLLNSDGSQPTWLYLNPNQSIVGMASNDVVTKQSNYVFVLRATNSFGLYAEINVEFKSPGERFAEPAYGGVFYYNSVKDTSNVGEFKAWFVRNIQQWMRKEYFVDDPNLYVYDFSDSVIKLTACKLCSDNSLSTVFLGFDIAFLVEGYLSEIKTYMSDFVNVNNLATQIIEDKCDSIAAPDSMETRTLEMCKLWSYPLVQDETEFIYNYDVVLYSAGGSALEIDSLVWLNNYTLEAFPDVQYFKSVNSPEFVYKLFLAGNLLSFPRFFKFENKIESLPEDSIEFVMTVDAPKLRSDGFDNFYINLVLRAVAQQIGPSNGVGLQFSKFEKVKAFTFKVAWYNCSLKADCADVEFTRVLEALRNLVLPSGATVIDIKTNCKMSPTDVTPLTLKVPVCGLFRKRELDTDVLHMLQSDGKLLPRDSWIRYRASEIYALPTESVVRVHPNEYRYILQYASSEARNVIATTEDERKNFYSVSLGFGSLLDVDTPFLDIQVKMLELVSSFNEADISDYRVLTFVKTEPTSESYYMTYGVCSVKTPVCKNDEQKLTAEEKRMMNENGRSSEEFDVHVDGYFDVSSIQRHTTSLIVDDKPEIVGPQPLVLNTDTCQPKCADVSKMFFDDNAIEDLKFELLFENDDVVPDSYWVQLDKRDLCAYPTVDIEAKDYSFFLKATDACSNSEKVQVIVKLREVETNEFFVWMTKSSGSYVNDVSFLRDVREKMVEYLRSDRVKGDPFIRSYDMQQSSVTFGDCAECDQKSMANLKEALKGFPEEVKIIKETKCNPQAPVCNPTKLIYAANVCSQFTERIPEDLCADEKDGGMSQLESFIYDDKGAPLSPSYWLQYDSPSRVLFGSPRYTGAAQTRFNYVLKVTDADGNEALIDVFIDVGVGTETPVLDYQLSVIGALRRSTTDAHHEQCIVSGLEELYKEQMLSSVQFARYINDVVNYTWSFCVAQPTEECDCKMIQNTQRMFSEEALRNTLKSCLTVDRINYNIYGACARTQPPQLVNGISGIEISAGEMFFNRLPAAQFLDAEDGTNRDLTLFVTDANNLPVDSPWLALDDNTICGVVWQLEYERGGFARDKTLTFYVNAQDACGKIKRDEFTITMTDEFPFTAHRITIWFEFPFDALMNNCTKQRKLLEILTDVGKRTDLVFRAIASDNDTANGTKIVIASREISTKNCEEDSEVVTQFYEKFENEERGTDQLTTRMNEVGLPIYRVSVEPCLGNPGSIWPFILGIILFLLLLLWLLWCCIPRCCPTCCTRFCTCCRPCCSKGGVCSSAKSPLVSVEATPQPTPTKPSPTSSQRSVLPIANDDVDPIVNPRPNPAPIPLPDPEPIFSPDPTPVPDPTPAPEPPPDPTPIVCPPKWIDNNPPRWSTGNHGEIIPHQQVDEIDAGDLIPPSLPVPYGGATSSFHTESWHDNRENNQQKYHNESIQNNAYGYQDNNQAWSSQRHQSNNQIWSSQRHQANSQVRRSPRHRGSNIVEYHGAPYSVRTVNRKSTSSRRTKQPITVKIRRSDLKNYLRSRQSRKIELSAKDLRRMLRSNTKIKMFNGDRYETVSPSPQHHRHEMRRSHSATSISDLYAVDEYGREVELNPRVATSHPREKRRSYSISSLSEFYDEYGQPAVNSDDVDLVFDDYLPTREVEHFSTLNRSAQKQGFTSGRHTKDDGRYDIYRSKKIHNRGRDVQRKMIEMKARSNSYGNRAFVDDSFL